MARMNVLLLVADDLRPEIYLPDVHTPNFDALSSRALVLGANYVQVPVCRPILVRCHRCCFVLLSFAQIMQLLI